MRLLFALLAAALLLAGCRGREDAAAAPSESSAPSSAQSREAPQQEAPESLPEPSIADSPQILTLTVPEGFTLARIGMELEALGVCTAEEFVAATQDGDFSGYPLVAAQTPSEERCFRLEGYLFPDTYQLYATDTPDAVIRKILDHTEIKFSADLRAEIQASGYTVDEILTLASIIEKEAFGHEQMPGISSVLHNRLDVGMQLQCDVTINYVTGAIQPFITGDTDRYNSYYNTYKCSALPAGAICNPSMDAILAALSPADTDYLFFVTDADKNYYYSATWEGHLDNVATAGINKEQSHD